jgi:hypothetical protein
MRHQQKMSLLKTLVFLGSRSENDLSPSVANESRNGHLKEFHTNIAVSTLRYDR